MYGQVAEAVPLVGLLSLLLLWLLGQRVEASLKLSCRVAAKLSPSCRQHKVTANRHLYVTQHPQSMNYQQTTAAAPVPHSLFCKLPLSSHSHAPLCSPARPPSRNTAPDAFRVTTQHTLEQRLFKPPPSLLPSLSAALTAGTCSNRGAPVMTHHNSRRKDNNSGLAQVGLTVTQRALRMGHKPACCCIHMTQCGCPVQAGQHGCQHKPTQHQMSAAPPLL